MDLQTIPEAQCEQDPQELIDRIMTRNRILEKRCNYLKRRRELLLHVLQTVETSAQEKNKLSESKVSVASIGCNLSTLPDESDLLQKYQEELQSKDAQISELKETVESLEAQIKNLQACNEEMQYQLARKDFIRSEKVSQSVIVPKQVSQTEKAQATIEKFVQPISTSSFKSTDGKPQTAEEKKKLLKRMSLQAAASAHIMAVKGDFTTLPGALEEIQSNKSIDQ